MRVKPLIQGNLDGLCGIYSIVNASRIISKTTEDGSNDLFHRMVKFLDTKHKFSQICVDGMDVSLLRKLIAIAGDNLFPYIEMPYTKSVPDTIDQFWEDMSEFMELRNRAIILGLGGRYNHWTVVTRITPNRIYLMDSSGLKWLNKSKSCLYEGSDSTPHELWPHLSIFLAGKV